MATLYAGTDGGLWTFEMSPDGLTRISTALPDGAVRDVATRPDDPTTAFVGCGHGGWGLHVVSDRGQEVSSRGLHDRWVWGVTVAPDGTLFVGTEPPDVYRSRDGGETLTPSPDVSELDSNEDWFFWYEPFEAGHVHGFGTHPDVPHRVLAGVEVGGAIRSEDGGDSWTSIDALEGEDVHNVAPAPSDADTWLAATGEGLYRSTDGGVCWRPVPALDGSYVAKVAFDAANRPCVSAAPDSKSDEGTFWRRDREWRPLHTSPADSLSGMIATHPTDPEVLIHTTSRPDECRLLVSRDGGRTWSREGPVMPRVRTLAVAEDPESPPA